MYMLFPAEPIYKILYCSMLAIVAYASVICFQYLSLGFMYRFMWRLLVRGDRWHWPAKHIYLLMCLMYTSFVILVAYIRDGSTPNSPRRLQDMAHASTVSVCGETGMRGWVDKGGGATM